MKGRICHQNSREDYGKNMNHTQRIAHVARQRRALTKALVKEAVDRYFEALAEYIASGEWGDLPGIGRQNPGHPRGGEWYVVLVWERWQARQATGEVSIAHEDAIVREVQRTL